MKSISLAFIMITLQTMLNAYPPLIRSILIRKNRIDIIANKEFAQRYLRDDFFIRYPQDLDLETLPETVVTIPFIMTTIMSVWHSGKNWGIEAMDEDLYYSLIELKKPHIFFAQISIFLEN